jgi:hypothetical protein
MTSPLPRIRVDFEPLACYVRLVEESKLCSVAELAQLTSADVEISNEPDVDGSRLLIAYPSKSLQSRMATKTRRREADFQLYSIEQFNQLVAAGEV